MRAIAGGHISLSPPFMLLMGLHPALRGHVRGRRGFLEDWRWTLSVGTIFICIFLLKLLDVLVGNQRTLKIVRDLLPRVRSERPHRLGALVASTDPMRRAPGDVDVKPPSHSVFWVGA